MTLPTKKKRGLRIIEHNQTKYYWKVKNNIKVNKFNIIIGLENQPFKFFTIDIDFIDPCLYFPMFASAQIAGRGVSKINQIDKITPKFIIEAIIFADKNDWTLKRNVKFLYENNEFIFNE